MTADERALLNAILAAPEDGLPRLVYADWLEERDRPERAEFIRLDCWLAQTKENRGLLRDRAKLAERRNQLLKAHCKRWRAELPQLPAVRWTHFVRGFVAQAVIHLDSDQLTWVDGLFQTTPLTDLVCHAERPDLLEALLARPMLRQLRTLRLSRALWSPPEPGFWRSLFGGSSNRIVPIIADFDWPVRLDTLALYGGGLIDDRDAEVLARIPPDRYFPILDLREVGWSGEVRPTLIKRFGNRVLLRR